ncbi:MAG: transcription-repair coupling factor [Clostridia bacterium]|nr:transcription-repair coupling factor [Clostridia bacterium]
MNGFEKILENLADYEDFQKALKLNRTPLGVIGIGDSALSHLISVAIKKKNGSGLIVSATRGEAEAIYKDLKFFLGENVVYFPESAPVFYDVYAAGRDVLGERLKALDKIYKDNATVVTTISALLSVTVPKEKYEELSFELKVGDDISMEELSEKMVSLGYTREEQVEGKGQFCIHGGIFDFYPYYSDCAFRIEFFDTEVDSVRIFDIESQRTIEMRDFARITPAGEILLSENERESLVKYIEKETEKDYKSGDEIKVKRAELMDRDAERLKENIGFPSIEKYIPVLYKEKPCLTDYTEDYTIFWNEPASISEKIKSSEALGFENFKELLERGIIPETDMKYTADYGKTLKKLTEREFIGFSLIARSCPDIRFKYQVNFTVKSINDWHGKIEFFYDALRHYSREKYKVIILAGSKTRVKNLSQQLVDNGYPNTVVESLEDISVNSGIVVTEGALESGFEYPLIRTVVISDKEIFGTERKKRTRFKVDKKNKIDNFADLNIGDFVVHQNHGIGKYVGIEQLSDGGVKRDYLKIVYKGDDVLYVPADQLSMVYKHIGKDGSKVSLNSLGGADWNRAKQKVKKACEDMADELLELYAAREQVKGIAFGDDTEWQRDFEAEFPYDETDDQLTSTSEIKTDMEKTKPMDRLLCGDVGYGKTEVAMRAAFKAVMAGYQVAYLVPTTILASQHYNTFRQRMKNYPVNIGLLSRFCTPAQERDNKKMLKTGELDIVIGTHKLLSDTVAYKKLGLLIIDEEQRFGVKHKEKIKVLKNNIDVLTLSATPIPRTLHMSMSGIRDMSILSEPPGERFPVATYVMEYDKNIIREAVSREIARGGQVYYLHNRVDGIFSVANEIASLVPDARVAVAHGRMKESELEEIMAEVQNGEIDVLVCTTIIETGLDIANVNTIIIEDADRLGLSQLYQLRGRVGRSDRLAYAYLTFRPQKVLNSDAAKRLRAIKEFTEFGSGFKIAMRDLEIRGMGNLIGAQQSGHMETVGYEMYCKILEEAINSKKGIVNTEEKDTVIDVRVSAFIPETYIKNHSQRLSAYKKVASIKTEADFSDVYDEMEDRFGTVPGQVENLMEISLIRNMCSALKFTEVKATDTELILKFMADDPPEMENIVKMAMESPKNIIISNSAKPFVKFILGKETRNRENLIRIKKIIEKLKSS